MDVHKEKMMQKGTKNFIALCAIGLMETQLDAKDGWEVALNFGSSFSKNETLTIKQSGYPDIILPHADIKTKAFTVPFYYGLRISRWDNDRAWEFEHIHQKIYIDDLPSEVEHFDITDGYNLFYLNHAWNLEEYGVITRVGLGFVVAHPDITVRGVQTHETGGGAIPMIWDTDSGYQWAGLTGQIAIEKEFQIVKNWYLSLEGKLTHSSADIDLEEDGSVEVPNSALHLLVGIKYNFNQ
jgi:hypothetical protein